jgi:hypothetical protein
MRVASAFPYRHERRPPWSLFPSPLRGGVRGGGRSHDDSWSPPSPTLPRKGGGSERAALATLTSTARINVHSVVQNDDNS